MCWEQEGTDHTYRVLLKRLAFAARYGKAGSWMLEVPGDFLQDYVDAVGELVEEENRPR